MNKIKNLTRRMTAKAIKVAGNNRGEGYIDTAIKILIAVVIGALLLAGIYALMQTNVLPTLSTKVTEMFNYKG
jgi:hypothetical protein